MEYVYEHQYSFLPEVQVVLRRLCTISQRSHDSITCTTTLLAVPVSRRGHPRAPFAAIIGASWLANGGPLRMLCYSVRQQAKWLSLFEAVQNCCAHPQSLVSMLAIQVNHLVLVSLFISLSVFLLDVFYSRSSPLFAASSMSRTYA